TKMDEYRLQYRGGKGIRNYGKQDLVAGIKIIDDIDDIIIISMEGIIIRMHAEDINIQSRYASGVRIMRLGETDAIVTVARTERDDEAEAVKPEDDGETEDIDIEALKAEEAENVDIKPSDDE
ncbi:MAG: DNA gyrase C-terminal beta-propeller domain-containing protein, partial [Oscillospiraceae bacterium]